MNPSTVARLKNTIVNLRSIESGLLFVNNTMFGQQPEPAENCKTQEDVCTRNYYSVEEQLAVLLTEIQTLNDRIQQMVLRQHELFSLGDLFNDINKPMSVDGRDACSPMPATSMVGASMGIR